MSHARVVPAAVAMYTRNYLTVGYPYVYSSPSLFLYFFISIFQMCSWGLEHSTEAKCSRSSSQAKPIRAKQPLLSSLFKFPSHSIDRSVGRSVGITISEITSSFFFFFFFLWATALCWLVGYPHINKFKESKQWWSTYGDYCCSTISKGKFLNKAVASWVRSRGAMAMISR